MESGTKKEKKEKKKRFVRMAAGQTWEDPTLAEWDNGKAQSTLDASAQICGQFLCCCLHPM